MAEHAENSERTERLQQDEDATRAMPAQQAGPPPSRTDEDKQRRARPSMDWQAAKEQIVGLLAGVARWLGLIFAVILVLHVIFVIGEANPDNGIAEFVRSWSDGLSLGFQDLFTPDDPKLRTLVNYGIAAIFWLVVSAIVAKIIRRIGGGVTS